MARRKQQAQKTTGRQETINGVPVPPELYEPTADTWQHHAAYVAWCKEHGFTCHVADRLGSTTHPANRRRHAAGQFGYAAGIIQRTNRNADLAHLKRLGLAE